MLGDLRADQPAGQPVIYRVNEIFRTIQGEATWAGTPSIFVRLQGCAVGCAFCDTKHTWSTDLKNQRTLMQVLNKDDQPRPEFAEVDADDLVAYVHSMAAGAGKVRHVVITGGEPANYDLVPLTRGLEEQGFRCQVETSGTAPVLVTPGTYVTMSPKIDQAGKMKVLREVVARADEIKHPTATEAHLGMLLNMLAMGWHRPAAPIWLQPLSQSENATERCIAWCYRYGFKLSIQTHKYLGLR